MQIAKKTTTDAVKFIEDDENVKAMRETAAVLGIKIPATIVTRGPQKTSAITLTGPAESTMYILAERKGEGATTTVWNETRWSSMHKHLPTHVSCCDKRCRVAKVDHKGAFV